MRMKLAALHVLFGVALAVVGGVEPAAAEVTNCSLKVDGFIWFVDQSGSMYQTHRDVGEVKETLAKQLLDQMNEQIPHSSCPGCGLKGGLYLFAPFESVKDFGRYYKDSMHTRISWIPDGQSVSLRLTPMGGGIESLEDVVSPIQGKTAIIVLSDGGQNTGADPVEATTELVRAHPNAQVHVISLADSPEGQDVNREVSKAGRGIYADGVELLHDASKMERFVRDVFCGEKPARRIVLRGVNFDFDKATIRPDGKPVLDEAVRTLQEESDVRVSVEGHTDSVGSDAYNMRLSKERAEAVADYLTAGGIAHGRISTIGFGESKPVASNETEDGRAQNRRVEFRVIAK